MIYCKIFGVLFGMMIFGSCVGNYIHLPITGAISGFLSGALLLKLDKRL